MNKVVVLIFFSLTGFSQWQSGETGTSSSFRSMDVVNKKVIWAGGTGATVIKSTDGSESWFIMKVSDAGLDFRGVAAFNKKVAVVVSAGLGENDAARIYRTEDGGKTWNLVFSTAEKGVFMDGICFLDRKHGFVFGDALGTEVYLLETFDAGKNWKRVGQERLPSVPLGSASFAASNSGMMHVGKEIWYALQSSILYSSDSGLHWELRNTGFPSGESNGIFGIHFVNRERGFLLGGDYLRDKENQINLAITADGGKRWQMGQIEPYGLKESAASYQNFVLVTGTSGTSISEDNGLHWEVFDNESYHVVRCAGKYCYAIGANGQFGKTALEQD